MGKPWGTGRGLGEQPRQWKTRSVTIYKQVPKYYQISIISIAILNNISCKSDLRTNPTSQATVDLVVYFKPKLEVPSPLIPLMGGGTVSTSNDFLLLLWAVFLFCASSPSCLPDTISCWPYTSKFLCPAPWTALADQPNPRPSTSSCLQSPLSSSTPAQKPQGMN